jgi:transglutaminase-like putative cysteine protease
MKRASTALGCCILLFAQTAAAHGGKVISELPCPVQEPMGMASDGESLFIADMATRTIVKLRTSDGVVTGKFDAYGNAPTGLAWHDGTLFSADRNLDWIGRRKQGAGPDLSPVLYYEKWPTGMVHDGTSLWVVDARESKIHRIDPIDGTTIASFAAPASHPTGIAFDGHRLWVADHGADELYMVDRRDGTVNAILPAPGPYPSALAMHNGALWVADYQVRKLFQVSLPDETPYLEDQERRAHVSFEVTYRAKGPGKIVNLVSYLALPADIPGQHVLGALAFDPQPARIETDKWGQRLAVFELGAITGGQHKRVRWDGDFSLFRVRFAMVPERVDAAKIPGNLQAYLADDAKYDLGSPVVSELVDKLTADRMGTYDKARAIYEHLAKVITYDRVGGWNNAATVLKRGTGSCSEYTFSLVAMLRKAGIPARYVGALSERGDEASFDDVFHRWAEAWMPGYGWVPMDANAAHGRGPGERASYFGGRSNRHVVTTISGGGTSELEWSYNSNEKYGSEGDATLEIQPMARFKPLEGGLAATPARVSKVIAPDLKEPEKSESGRWGKHESRLNDPWIAAIAVMLAIGLGYAVGRGGRAVR